MASVVSQHSVEESSFHIICFSKDRPFQAREFLRSVHKYVVTPGIQIRISMLYTFSSEQVYGSSYAKLIMAYPSVNFFKEERGKFSSQLRDLVRSSANFTIFAVDDIIFYKQYSLEIVAEAFSSLPDFFGSVRYANAFL